MLGSKSHLFCAWTRVNTEKSCLGKVRNPCLPSYRYGAWEQIQPLLSTGCVDLGRRPRLYPGLPFSHCPGECSGGESLSPKNPGSAQYRRAVNASINTNSTVCDWTPFPQLPAKVSAHRSSSLQKQNPQATAPGEERTTVKQQPSGQRTLQPLPSRYWGHASCKLKTHVLHPINGAQ